MLRHILAPESSETPGRVPFGQRLSSLGALATCRPIQLWIGSIHFLLSVTYLLIPPFTAMIFTWKARSEPNMQGYAYFGTLQSPYTVKQELLIYYKYSSLKKL
jgi:hypothetical protein